MFHLGGKSDSEKRLDALHSINDMFEFLDKFEKKWQKNKEKMENTMQKVYLTFMVKLQEVGLIISKVT